MKNLFIKTMYGQIVLLFVFGLFFAGKAVAAPFTTGNIVVCRVGDGTAALSSAATAVFLDEYTTAGVFVQAIPLPVADSGANQILTVAGSSTNDCHITRSANLKYILIGGYDAAPGTAAVAGTNTATIVRVLGRVDGLGASDTSTTTTQFSTGNNRSVTSTDGTNLWAIGSNSGVIFTTLGATGAGTVVSTTVTNNRAVHVFNGQLYTSDSSGATVRLGAVGTGTPTTSGQTIVNIPGFPVTGAPNGFFFCDLDAGVAGHDTLYVSDDGSAAGSTGGGVKKFSLVAGSWTYNGTFPASVAPSIPATTFFGLTGTQNGTTVNLFATRSGSQLVSFVDSTGYNVAPTAIPTLLATAATNTAFRSVEITPLSPTAASASIAGQIKTADGRGIGKVIVMLAGGGLTAPKFAITNPFGYYRFEDVEVGSSYIVSVSSKRYTFDPSSRVINVNDNVGDADFIAEP